jgi:hypothetical protein
MKKTSTAKTERIESDNMRPEYDFDYRKARPNRFAGRIDKIRLVIALDPDISEVFTTPESVNAVLRALIATMPERAKRRTTHRSSSRTAKKEHA